MNDLRLAEGRLAQASEQLQCLLRDARLPHLMLALCVLCAVLLLDHELSWMAILLQGAALAVLAGLHWLVLYSHKRFGVIALGHAGWRLLQLGGSLLTGTLTAAVLAQLLPAAGWQQTLWLALLVVMTGSFGLASRGCMVSFLAYIAPMLVGGGVFFFVGAESGWLGLTVVFTGLVLVELLAVRKVAALLERSLLLRQSLQDIRRQYDDDTLAHQKEMARLHTSERSLQLQVESLQAHLEQNNSEQLNSLRQALEKVRTGEERLQRALDASNLSLWDWDLVSGRLHQTGADRLLGYTAAEAGKLLADLRPLMHPDDLPVLHEAMTAHLRQETGEYRVEYRVRHAEGHWVWIEDSGQAITRDETGRVLRMLGTRRDITQRRQHEDELKLASIVFESGGEAILVMDAQLQILTTNQTFTRITGFEREQAHVFKEHLHEALRVFGLDKIRRTLRDEGSWHAEVTGRHSSSRNFPLRLRLQGVQGAQPGELAYVVAFFTDLTQFREAQKRLDYLAWHDDLTGLANRSLFHQQLQETVDRPGLSVDGFGLLHIDLDRFKLLNECFGTETGDAVLRIVGRRLQRFAGPQRSLARLGGNEFMMLVAGQCDPLALENLADEVLNALRAPCVTAGEELLLSASIGISLMCDDAMDAHTLLNRAALALAHAKYLGGNRCQLFSEDMPARSSERLQLEQQLRRGLKEGHVQAHYQPKLCLIDSRIYGVEALARWYHPERGMVSPVEFIPLAEETGLIAELSEIILGQACTQAKAWHDAGTPLQVSVNLSVQHLRQGNIVQLVRAALDESGLPAHLLELELTESQLLDVSGRLLKTISEVRAMGVHIAVDDFGTGYSSLGYLKHLPANCLKIDRSFICDLSAGNHDAVITRAIIAMAHGLGLQVVAEGVETQEQLEVLRDMGCDAVQGYLIARPGPVAELQELLQ